MIPITKNDYAGGGNICNDRDMIRKMRADSIMWIENFLKIRTETGELVSFILNAFQKKLMTAILDIIRVEGDAFFVVLNGRQLGILSVCQAMML
jgi:hypothetical protein